jgi:hypothetical protein
MAGAEVLGVRAATQNVARFKDCNAVTRLNEAMGGSKPRRAGTNDDDVHGVLSIMTSWRMLT